MPTKNRKCEHDKWLHVACYKCGRIDARKRKHVSSDQETSGVFKKPCLVPVAAVGATNALITTPSTAATQQFVPPSRGDSFVSTSRFEQLEQIVNEQFNQRKPILETEQEQPPIFLTHDPIPYPDSTSPDNKDRHLIVCKNMLISENRNYQVIGLINSGGTAQTFLGYVPKFKRKCAIKILKFGYNDLAQREWAMLEHITNKCSVSQRRLFSCPEDLFMWKTHSCIVLEFLGSYDLCAWITHNNGLPMPIVRDLTRQLLEGLHSLHSTAGVIHCDIKPSNIVICDAKAAIDQVQAYSDGSYHKPYLKIIDFNSATHHGQFTKKARPMTTRGYRSPEMLLQREELYSSAIDIWSLGCVVYHMLTGKRLINCGNNTFDEVASVCKALSIPLSTVERDAPAIDKTELKAAYDKSVEVCAALTNITDMKALSFLRWCLNWDSSERSNAHTLLQHSFIKAGVE